MSDIRIIIADDDLEYATELSELLDRQIGITVDSLVTSGHAVLDRLAHRPADLVVMDITLNGLDGLTTTAGIAAAYHRTAVLLLSAHDDPEILQECAEVGASCVTKDLEPDQMIRAVRAVAEGARLVAPSITAHPAIEAYDAGRDPAKNEEHGATLSTREVEVLHLLSDGKLVEDVAFTLDIAPETVRNHLANVCRKLGVESQAEALSRAGERGLLDHL